MIARSHTHHKIQFLIMSTFSIKILRVMFFLSAVSVRADNPVIKNRGVSDPHVRVFDGKVYLYAGHDESPSDKTWVMKRWQVYSSTNLVDWIFESYIDPKNNFMGAGSRDCWAGDAAKRNGKYFFYFSDRDRSIGVMTAGSPTGPFTDPLGKPLVAPMHDPTVFVDDDGTPYLIYGHKLIAYRIARLNEDMISLAEDPRDIAINGEAWQQAPEWMDKNYLFKHNGRYYLTWGRDYAVSDNVYGPYESIGAMGNGHHLNEFAHGSFFEWNGQRYYIWCHYLKRLGSYYYKYRQSIMTYCHFTNDGRIVLDTDYLDHHAKTGVGQYNATWPEIEAEWFYGKTPGLQKQDCAEGGFEMTGWGSGEWLHYANVEFGKGATQFAVQIANPGSGAELCIHANIPDGPVIGTLYVPCTGDIYKHLSCPIEKISGKHDIYLSSDTARLRLNRFSFDTTQADQ